MAAIQPGLLDVWVTDQIWPPGVAPKTGSTGTLDAWVTDQIWLNVYAAKAAVVTGVAEGPFRRVYQPVFGGMFG